MEIIIFVVGAVCSGKDTYANRFDSDYIKVDVGNIVRKLTKQERRTFDKTLDNAIIDELHGFIDLTNKSDYRGMVITGCRQKSIIHSIMCWYKYKIPTRIVHLDPPEQELKARYVHRAAAKDTDLSFEEVVERDNKLGYQEMINSIYRNYEPFTLKQQ